jgi:TetR/AcrR family transcriptional regulator, transcriptional repressor for nem operon
MDKAPNKTTKPATGKRKPASADHGAPEVKGDMRQSIKRVAARLLTLHGLNGMSFRDIALELGITTTNIHYHFGNKQGLVDEVVGDYVAEVESRHRAIWLAPNHTLAEKLRQLVEYNWERYQQVNTGRDGGNTWSLIGRMRLESQDLSENARKSLSSFTAILHELIRTAVDDAWRRGELDEATPRQDLAFLILNIVNSSSVFTHGTGGFDRLELFFDAFSRVMLSAYAGPASQPHVTAARSKVRIRN